MSRGRAEPTEPASVGDVDLAVTTSVPAPSLRVPVLDRAISFVPCGTVPVTPYTTGSFPRRLMVECRNECLLLRRWREGDRSSGSVLLRPHIRSVRYFFSTKLVSRDQVDDLVQLTLLRCIERKDGWQRSGSFRAYLLGIARHVLYRHFRWQRRHGGRFTPLETSVEDLQRGQLETVEVREASSGLMEAMQRIPVDFQITLELTYWHGLSTAETAMVLGVAEPTVRTRILRAKRRLREVLPPPSDREDVEPPP